MAKTSQYTKRVLLTLSKEMLEGLEEERVIRKYAKHGGIQKVIYTILDDYINGRLIYLTL